MNTTIMLISAAGAAALTMAALLTGRRADVRGIALQTVIVMVVLLAIAGTVAGVLLSKSGEVTNQLEATNIGTEAKNYQHKGLCQRAGHGWYTGATGLTSIKTTGLVVNTCYAISEILASATAASVGCDTLGNWSNKSANVVDEPACTVA